jgi:hypothetical protein
MILPAKSSLKGATRQVRFITSLLPESLLIGIIFIFILLNAIQCQNIHKVVNFGPPYSQELLEKTSFFVEEQESRLTQDFCEKLGGVIDIHLNTRCDSETEFLKNLFYDIHHRFLKEYRQYVSVNDLICEGTYDCVTASALFSIIFESLNVNYIIQKTDYHIYLVLYLNDKNIFIETTDPRNGYITDSTKINKILTSIVTDAKQTDESDYYKFKSSVNHTVNIVQLAGIHFYNLAIKSFNMRKFKDALELINKALNYYHSDRILEVKALLTTL